MVGETFSQIYRAEPEAVLCARASLTEFARTAGAGPERLDAIRLAVSEAVTNAVLHAYEKGQPGMIGLSATYVSGELWLFVSDDGAGLRARRSGRGLGLGLAVIAQLSDDFQIISRAGGGTELRMLFKLTAPRRSAAAQPRRGSFASASAPA